MTGPDSTPVFCLTSNPIVAHSSPTRPNSEPSPTKPPCLASIPPTFLILIYRISTTRSISYIHMYHSPCSWELYITCTPHQFRHCPSKLACVRPRLTGALSDGMRYRLCMTMIPDHMGLVRCKYVHMILFCFVSALKVAHSES